MPKLESIKIYLTRNRYRKDTKFSKNEINLLYYKYPNIGDCLSPIVFDYMLKRNNISLNQPTKHKYQKIACIGSIIQNYYCDMTIWGSGLIKKTNFEKGKKLLQKMDIRAVRGPLTLENLKKQKFTKQKNCAFGDPAILMPLIYSPKGISKKYKVSFIPHYLHTNLDNKGLHIIDVRTNDYKYFINEIVSSDFIISSSLHGIILSETYGVPCIWLKTSIDDFKFLDYYYSTNRKNISFANSLDEALKMQTNELPNNLDKLREDLLNSFPYDLWK